MSEMIRLEQVCLRFKTGFALDGLSFQVESGQVFGFLGPSGAGKTTTIKLLTKQLVKDSGQIYLFGKPVEEVSRDDFEKIGVLTDTNGLYERMSIEENLKFFARLRGVSPERGTELLKRMGLYDSRKTPVKKCSKGMRQRVSLAVVLLHSPKLLFLDEPTSGLDPATIQEVHRLLLEMKDEGTTIFLTTHNMEEAAEHARRIIVLDHGKVVLDGTPQQVFAEEDVLRRANLTIPYAARLVRELKRRGADLPGQAVTVEHAYREILSWLQRRDAAAQEMEIDKIISSDEMESLRSSLRSESVDAEESLSDDEQWERRTAEELRTLVLNARETAFVGPNPPAEDQIRTDVESPLSSSPQPAQGGKEDV